MDAASRGPADRGARHYAPGDPLDERTVTGTGYGDGDLSYQQTASPRNMLLMAQVGSPCGARAFAAIDRIVAARV